MMGCPPDEKYMDKGYKKPASERVLILTKMGPHTWLRNSQNESTALNSLRQSVIVVGSYAGSILKQLNSRASREVTVFSCALPTEKKS